MSSPTVVLITGANRGIGRGLLAEFLAKPNHIVIAGNRSPEDETSKSLASLPAADGTKLIVVKIDATVADDPDKAVRELEDSYGIDHLDIVVANAAIALSWPKVSEVQVEDSMYPGCFLIYALSLNHHRPDQGLREQLCLLVGGEAPQLCP